jgi:murein DD-endopeptidase MepM/ murein hydrolase activator NlpD
MARMLRRLVATVVCAGVLAGCSAPRPPAAGTAPAGPGGPTSASPTAVARSPGPTALPASPAATRYVFPVDGKASYAREHHHYPAADIIAPCGAVVRAPTDGQVLEVSREDRFDKSRSGGADRGGLSYSLLGGDGVRYYGSHLSQVDPQVQPGVRMVAGDRLGLVGRTGNANNTCHLHFGVSPPCATAADWWIRRGVVWPWPYLDAWRAGTPRSPAAEVTQWHATHGCPPEPTGPQT